MQYIEKFDKIKQNRIGGKNVHMDVIRYKYDKTQ